LQTVELLIEGVVYRGKGLARVDGMVCFVPGTLPGETVRARIVERRRRYMAADLTQVVSPSPARISPACPLAFAPGIARPCPGCAYQHVAYSEELRLKQSQLTEMLEHHAGVPATCFDNPVPSPAETAYRNKIVLHEGNLGDCRVMGYVGADNRTIIDVESCPIAVNDINASLDAVRSGMGANAGTAGPRIRHTFRYTPHDGVVHFRGRADRRARWLTESTEAGEIRVPWGSFFQVNNAVTGKLMRCVLDLAAGGTTDRVVDLYCGVGLFAVGAALAGAGEVLGIDMDHDAVRAAKHNASNLAPGRRVFFLAAPAAAGLRRAMETADPGSVTLIADPPRGGLEKEVIDVIRRCPPARLIYVSCAADTLARDLGRLREAKYAVRRARLFDMFPRTALFETVVELLHDAK